MRAFRKVALIALAVAAAFGVGLVSGRRPASGIAEKGANRSLTRYQCPMHPAYVSDKPGTCPICGMSLVPTAVASPASSGARAAGRKIAYYRSPMDPSVRSENPAKDSMGMDFIPVYEDVMGPAASVGGRVAITLTPERLQFLGVRSETVLEHPLSRTIRTVGRVAVDERRLHHVHTKFEGYVEHLYVDFTGKLVKKGEPLLSIYSPELVATQQEYLLALRAQQELARSGIPSVSAGTADLLAAARRRLLLWDIRAEDIERLERSGESERTLDLHAEIGGYVVQKDVYHGMRVMPADTLFDIADLSHLWVLADVYESDLPSVRLGMGARLELAYLPGRSWSGTVTNVAPTVEEKTRTIKVRIEVENQAGALKPDMFADVFLTVDFGKGLSVPESALIRAGDRTLVFLDKRDGRFEPREVKVGPRVNGSFQVLSGLAAGDRVVTSANFLIDSESSLKAALASMSSGTAAPAVHQH